ncbi:arsenic resistance N-acetyltransferase ArsN2 [Burkholderia sp. 1B3(2022)]|uniref:arsenic resistance N-acetyltransferase ArsN2 n=1 Tax=Burkholderia sp. 1B3(2022) TaxID=2997425 RepID=UPI002FC8CDA1
MSVTIYHNPECGTSRNVLALLRTAGEDPQVIEYLQTPPDRETLKRLIADSGMAVRDMLRIKGTPYKELGLDDPALQDAQLIDAMLAHPILINRPLVVAPRGTRLCRPSDTAVELLDKRPTGDVMKEEGVPFIVRHHVAGSDHALQQALLHAALPTDDLEEPGRSFFAYETLAGSLLGYGGFERYGDQVLVRSLVVRTEHRRHGIGRNMLAVLLRDAFDAGGRTAWLLTSTAAAFFEAAGFKAKARELAPAEVLATRQAAALCPASAVLMSRAIVL